ncbi:MAG: methylmalonyl-CoA mutase subunit beta [Mesorhizobium sp.]|nr:methylmalonyl-CoA mutase subunit beta [Mesorhizobium sp.]MBL8578972.1 methylmalonyl-CoA mutase subunit beta [Mesorhizobium sp.]
MNLARVLDEIEFPTANRDLWRAIAEKTLAGQAIDSALVSHTADDIRIDPILERDPTGSFLPRKLSEGRWAVVQRIDDPDPVRANRQALEDIEQGATGLSLVFEGAPNAFGYGLPASPEALETVLDEIPLARTYVRMDIHPASRAVADWFVAYLTRRRADPAKLSLCFGIDPAAIFAGTGRLSMSIEALQASMPQSLAHFFALGVPGVLLEADGRVYHNAGATEAQELGAMLASAAAHLRLFEDARQALVYAAPHIGFAVSVDQDQFVSMAKIRALRKLWARLLEVCSIPPSPATIHAETSWRMLTAADPETNVLRSTIACFAAAVGGADSISVLPHTLSHGLPNGFARRIARNTQLVAASESHLDFVADPSSGSGSIEALTDALCEHAWDEFRAIEREGGILRSLADGKLQQRIVESRDERVRKFNAGERHIVGTTIYRRDSERPVETLTAEKRPMPTDGAVHCPKLEALRIDQLIGGQ